MFGDGKVKVGLAQRLYPRLHRINNLHPIKEVLMLVVLADTHAKGPLEKRIFRDLAPYRLEGAEDQFWHSEALSWYVEFFDLNSFSV